MKKFAVLFTSIAVLFTSMVFCAELPIPFAKIKEHAMKSNKDKDGDYVLWSDINNGGKKEIFIIGLLKPNTDKEQIGIGNNLNEHLRVIVYRPDSNEYVMYHVFGMFSTFQPLTKEQAIEIAFLYIREMVKRNLL